MKTILFILLAGSASAFLPPPKPAPIPIGRPIPALVHYVGPPNIPHYNSPATPAWAKPALLLPPQLICGRSLLALKLK